jgi:elongation factor G
VDFTVEVERSLRVLDGAIAIFSAVEGVEPQSETVWRQADRYRVPRIAYVNKMDRVGADFLRVVEEMKEKLYTNPVVIQLPVGVEDSFVGVVDLIEEKAYIYDSDILGARYRVTEIPEELRDNAAEYREKMLEQIAESDDEFMERYLEGKDITPNYIRQILRRATISLKLVPVLCGSSFRNKGVQPLLDAVVYYLPSPADLPPVKGMHPRTGKEEERRPSDDEPFSALVFKIMTDPHMGQLVFFRIYSGKVRSGTYVYNASKNIKERLSRLLLMHANKREDINEANAGDIVAAIGFKNATTGDTLCDPAHPIIFESMQFPEPVISVAIEPKTKADHDRLSMALQKLALEDPTFRVKVDEETGQTIISGMGELHLEIIVDRLRREFNVQANVGKPQVAYKETITVVAEGEGKYIKQTGGRGQYGHVKLILEPLETGKGFEFVDEIKGGVIPKEFIPAIEAGVKEAMTVGVLLGYPMTDIRVRVVDGSYHEVDSSDLAFKIAASLAFRQAAERAKPIILEPIMKLEITVPDEYLGEVISDLNARRGKVESLEMKAGLRIVRAFVPLAEMFGYATSLRSITQGRGNYSMHFYRYEPTPEDVMQNLKLRYALV